MIKIDNAQQFRRLIAGLSDDIVSAHIHWKMHQNLCDAMLRYPLVRQQSNTFWHLTLKAHAGAAVSHLCRAFDQEQKSLHLLSWLLTIKENLHLFSVEEFRARLKDNPFVESLAEGNLRPDDAQLETDIALCTDTDPLVRKLVAMRGTSFAHRSAALARRGAGLPEALTPTRDEFEQLLERARDILNRYTRLFAAESFSTSIIGADDFEYIFSTVQSAVEASRASVEEYLQAHAAEAHDTEGGSAAERRCAAATNSTPPTRP